MAARRPTFALVLSVAFVAGCGDGVPPAGVYATISGRVTDAKTGAPIPFATVAIDSAQYVRTDADGNYVVKTVPTGPWSWSAQASGYASQVSDDPPPLGPGEKRVFPIALKPGGAP